MYKCKPLSLLPIQSDRDFARAEVGDTVLIPEQRFETLFGEYAGGILGIKLEFINGEESITLYATASPHSELVDGPFNDVFLPDWVINTVEQRSLKGIEEYNVVVERAGPLGQAASVIARPLAIRTEDTDLRAELEAALYDNRYIHAHTYVHVPSGDIWIESVTDADGFEMEVGQLGLELALEIVEAPGVVEAKAAAACVAKAATEAVDPAIVRAARLKYFEGKKQ